MLNSKEIKPVVLSSDAWLEVSISQVLINAAKYKTILPSCYKGNGFSVHPTGPPHNECMVKISLLL